MLHGTKTAVKHKVGLPNLAGSQVRALERFNLILTFG